MEGSRIVMNLIVAGGGEGVYKNLWPITLSKDPQLDMRIAVIIDILPKEMLHPKMQEIIEKERITFLHPGDLKKLPLPEKNSAGVVMTPNDSHLWYIEFFTSLGIPVYAEKPVVTNLKDLNGFLKVAAGNPGLVYAAEYCTDGKALAFLNMIGVIASDDPRRAYITLPNNTVNLNSELGRLISIDAKILEGEGTAGTADHRVWLLKGAQGGMIRDLLSHLFGPLYDAGLASSDTIDLRVELGRYEKGMPLGAWRPLKDASEGETYAVIEGKFLMPFGTPTFKFQVGKYWPRHEREMILRFERGLVTINFEKPFEVIVETKHSKIISRFIGDFYPTMAFLDFKRFIGGKTHGHIGRAAAIVRFNEQARQAGLLNC